MAGSRVRLEILVAEIRTTSLDDFLVKRPHPLLVALGLRRGLVIPAGAATAVIRQSSTGDQPLMAPHPLAGQALVLDGGNRALCVGREPDNDLVINDDSISRHHCVLEATPAGVTVTDLGSTNGSKVNDERVQARAPVAVADGAVLTFGRYNFQLLHARSLYRALGEGRDPSDSLS